MPYPLMTIAVPAYNHGAYIEACLCSIRDQTYPRLELVVINDGSNDDTESRIENFLKEHRQRFEKVVFRSRQNQGSSATSNECLQAASGNWVHFIGSDDLFCPDKIMAQWQATEDWGEPDLALVYGDTRSIDADGKLIDRPAAKYQPEGPDHKAYIALFKSNFIFPCTVMVRRDTLLAIGGFNNNAYFEDWLPWIRLAARHPIGRVGQVVSHFRHHDSNTSLNGPKMLHAWMVLTCRFLEEHGDLIPTDLRRQNFRKHLHRLYRWAKKNQPSTLPRILRDVVALPFSTPGPDDYQRYAELIEKTL